MSGWRCADGHPTRERAEDDLLLPCGCVFNPNSLTSLAVAIAQGVDIPGAVDRWREMKGMAHGFVPSP